MLPFAAGLWGALVCDRGGGVSSTRPSSVSGEACGARSSRGFGAERGCSRWCSGGTCSKTSCAATLVTETEPQKSPVSCCTCINAGTGGAGAGCSQFCPWHPAPHDSAQPFSPVLVRPCEQQKGRAAARVCAVQCKVWRFHLSAGKSCKRLPPVRCGLASCSWHQYEKLNETSFLPTQYQSFHKCLFNVSSKKSQVLILLLPGCTYYVPFR